MIIDIVKIFLPAISAFVIGILITPILTDFLYKHKMWKKKSVSSSIDGRDAPISASLHKDEQRKTPRMGGIVVWASTAITILVISAISKLLPYDVIWKLDFFSRNQTWIPLMTLIVGALTGLIDDFLVTRETPDGGYVGGGLSLSKRLGVVGLLGVFCGYWFYDKLDVSTINLPQVFGGELHIGIFLIPIFAIVALAVYSGGVIDGLDGLSGGVFSTIFTAYAGIAFYQQQIDLAAFCATLLGGLLAFLWFNIPPARFYLSETGSMALTITLTVIAFMTDSLGGGYGVVVLPVIALPLVISSGSVIIQLISKKFRGGKKVFLVAPLHHHFEALGWPSYKVVMRYWIFSVISALLGLILALSF